MVQFSGDLRNPANRLISLCRRIATGAPTTVAASACPAAHAFLGRALTDVTETLIRVRQIRERGGIVRSRS